MIVYLTSNIGGSYKVDGKRVPTFLSEDNGLLDSLKQNWKVDAKVLIMSADPSDFERNDSVRDIFEVAFPMSGLTIGRMDMCDSRNEDVLQNLSEYDVVILSGGHVPTQNAFFKRVQLKEKLAGFEGILIGISAGTMNSAETVYAQPELTGESVDKEYQRFLTGLGLTKIMVIPHYQDLKDSFLDGQRLFEDITYPDSFGREFYALVDGSYILLEDGIETVYGEAYLIKDGSIRQICEKGGCLER